MKLKEGLSGGREVGMLSEEKGWWQSLTVPVQNRSKIAGF